jgi:uncharacterized repeat protein (TIGR03803 family)
VQFQYSTIGGSTWINAGAAEATAPFGYTFSSPLADGAYAFRAIGTDNAGNSAVSNNYSITTLASFGSSSGFSPQAGLLEDSSGNLFGTTFYGGTYGDGTVYEIAAGSGVVTTLASFASFPNYCRPNGKLVEDSSGDLFGTTQLAGTVFEVVHGSGVVTTIATLGGTDGSSPNNCLIMDSGGNLFGTTYQNGDYGYGTVFEVVAGSGAATALASFNKTDGSFPAGCLVEDSSGNLFGLTGEGGANPGPEGYGVGTVFEIAKGSGAITVLASFNSTNEAFLLPTSLVEDTSGNLFGANSQGGTLFEVVKGSGAITTLALLNTPSGLVEDGSGNLFGLTDGGGAYGYGTTFEMVQGSGVITTLASITNGYTNGDLIEDSNGNFFGTTEGDMHDEGTVYELSTTVTFSIDTTLPIVSITAEPPAVSYSTSASFSFTGNDPTSDDVSSGVSYFQYQLDNGGFRTATSPVNLAGLTNGSHTFQVEAVDNAGNVSVPASYTWIVAPLPITISSVAVNGSTAPIISASEANNMVQITTDGPSGFSVGQNVLIAGVGGGYDGSYVISAVGNDTFSYVSGTAGLSPMFGDPNGNNGTATVASASSGLLTNGATNATSQRSMVDAIVYTFNQAVNLGANAITLTAIGQDGIAPTVAYASPDGGFTWVVTFSVNGVQGNSIANGEYQIVLNASAVSAVSGGGTLAANDTETFYRLYGDTIGNGHQKVAAADNNTFLGAFNTKSTQTAFLAYLDYDDAGRINSADNNAFLGDFNIKYSGFTATI